MNLPRRALPSAVDRLTPARGSTQTTNNDRERCACVILTILLSALGAGLGVWYAVEELI